MTYRRLFHILLIGSTLVLAGVWSASFKKAVAVSAGSPMPPLSLSGYMSYANINLVVNFSPATRFGIDWDHGPAREFGPGVSSRLIGKFYWSEMSWGDPSDPADTYHALGFPVWIPYLLFIASAWGICRLMERRTAGGKEKLLAEKRASENI